MHRSRFAPFVLAAVLSSAAPLAAGELLVPLATGVAADGTVYSTRVWVSNTGASTRRWTATYIAPVADGTQSAAGDSIAVNPGATVQVTGLAPNGQAGMLLISGAPQLLVTARLEATGADGAPRAAVAGPLVRGRDLAAANSTVELHGLSNRPGGLITDFHLINASRTPSQCQVDPFRADGSRITDTIVLKMPALSVRVFEKALDILKATNLDDARFAVTCDQDFYTYARIYKPGSAELNIMRPADALAGAK
jgi:hypothetical protein